MHAIKMLVAFHYSNDRSEHIIVNVISIDDPNASYIQAHKAKKTSSETVREYQAQKAPSSNPALFQKSEDASMSNVCRPWSN